MPHATYNLNTYAIDQYYELATVALLRFQNMKPSNSLYRLLLLLLLLLDSRKNFGHTECSKV